MNLMDKIIFLLICSFGFVGFLIILSKTINFLFDIQTEAEEKNKKIELAMVVVAAITVIISVTSLVISINQGDRVSKLETTVNLLLKGK